MAYVFPLTASLKHARWKVKIRDKEICEPPHVSILRGTECWRVALRTGRFLDGEPDPTRVPAELLDSIRGETAWRTLCDAWNEMYPHNPVDDGEQAFDDSDQTS